MSDIFPEDPDQGGGLSPAALVVYVSTDMLPNWRLQKSVALDNAEWALKVGRPDIAAMNVKGARFAHLQIMRIKARLRAFRTFRNDELERLDSRVMELRNAKPDEAALEAGTYGSAAPGRRQEHHANRRLPESQHQDGLDVQVPSHGEAQAASRDDGRDDRAQSSGDGTRDVPPGVVAAPRLLGLSPRELQVVALLAESKTNAAIATELDTTENNVGVRIWGARKKLNLGTRDELAEWGRKNLIEARP